jgi:GntR family transcriptional regulator/MocR family aminotransferase
MLPPSWLSWALITAKTIEDGGSEITGQLTLADFISRNELDRHLRRMRQRYARRRTVLLTAVARELPGWRPLDTCGGLHTVVRLPPGVDEPALVAAAARQGAGVEGISLHSYLGDAAPGLVLGHAHLAEPAIEQGIRRLRAALSDLAAGS